MKKRVRQFLSPSVIPLMVFLILAAWPDISRGLFHVTGEEQLLPQLTGATQLAFNLARPPLQLANDVPVVHAGLNPFGVNTFLQNEADPHKRRLAAEMVANAGFGWIRQDNFPGKTSRSTGAATLWIAATIRLAWPGKNTTRLSI